MASPRARCHRRCAREELDNPPRHQLQPAPPDGPSAGTARSSRVGVLFRARLDVLKRALGRSGTPCSPRTRGALVTSELPPRLRLPDLQGAPAHTPRAFFGRDPRTAKLVEDMNREGIWGLKRGGHITQGLRRVKAAWSTRGAHRHSGQDHQGMTLGRPSEPQRYPHMRRCRSTHQGFRDRLYARSRRRRWTPTAAD